MLRISESVAKLFNYMRIILTIFSVMILFQSCDKDHSNNCLSSTGDIIFETRNLESFTYLSLHDKFNLYLITDSVNFLKIEAGENIIDGITSDISNDTLTIRNTNRCNWLRSYKKPINLYVSSYTLRRLFIYGYSNIETVNTFKANYIVVEAASPISKVTLDLDVRTCYFSAEYTTGDFILTGTTDSLRIFNFGTGYVFAQGLESRRCWVLNNSTGDIHVKTSDRLHVEIHRSGNIYYYQEPNEINIIEISSTGQLIPK